VPAQVRLLQRGPHQVRCAAGETCGPVLDARIIAPVPDDLIRISVGIESIEDLRVDLLQALG
jgi:cystathionine beta-lyase/cystathionine gamma-synthase